jgi:hypothetical protein
MREAIHKTGFIITFILFTLVSLFFLSLSFWAYFLSAYFLLVVSLTEVGIFFPLYLKRIKLNMLKIVAGVLLFGISSMVIIPEVNSSFATLADKLSNGNNSKNYTRKEKLSIYMLNIYMGVFGYPLYPEASKETLLLMFPTDTGDRVYQSDFPYGSDIVKGAINSQLAVMKETGARKFHRKLKEIYWEQNNYTMGHREARYALALNSVEISLDGEKIENGIKLDVTTSTRISYAKNNNAVLIRKPSLVVNEGLFRVLEECGYFHPYKVVYKFTIVRDMSEI